MNSSKEMLKKLVEELPETKTGEAIDYLLFLKERAEQDLYLSEKEEEQIWDLIKTEERLKAEDVKKCYKSL